MRVHCDKYSSISLPEKLTGSAVELFQREVTAACDGESAVVAIDCAGLTMCTSSHIGLLWQALEQCREQSRDLRLDNVGDDLRRVLQMLNLDGFFLPSSEEQLPEEPRTGESNLDHPPFRDTVQLSFAGVMESLNNFMAYLKPLTISDIMATDLRLLLYEVMMNTKAHSGLTENDSIDITMNLAADRFVFTFIDDGVEFDPTATRPREHAAQRALAGHTRGFGLQIVRALADKITYVRRNDRKNILTIEKSWSQTR